MWGLVLFGGRGNPALEHGFVVNGPLANRQLADLDTDVTDLLNFARDDILVIGDFGDGALRE